MRPYLSRFEIVDDTTKELAAVVKAVDECAAEITINCVWNATSWRELSAEVEKCLKAMQLEGDEK